MTKIIHDRPMARVSDAIKLNIWQLHQDGVLIGQKCAYYEGVLKGTKISVRFSAKAWRENTLAMDVSINEREAIVLTVLREARPHHQFGDHLAFVCPTCRKSTTRLFIGCGNLKCRDCAHLYRRAFNARSDINVVVDYYVSLKCEHDRLEAKLASYDERKKSGISRAWDMKGHYRAPSRLRSRLNKLERRLCLGSAKIWARAASIAEREARRKRYPGLPPGYTPLGLP